MSSKKIVAVTGATGTQGGSVARDLLKDGTFAVRAVTRNPDSAAAQELKKLGAEVVKADIENVDSLKDAFEGAYGVFGLTVWTLFFAHNFNQAETQAHETQHGKNLVDAAKAAGVKHFVWSTLDKLKSIHVYHFISKYNVNAYLEASGSIPYTHLYTSFYYNNLVMPGFEMLKKNDDGSLTLALPVVSDAKIHSFDGSDVGRWAVPIFKNPARYIGKDVHAVAEFISANEYAEILRRVTGKTVHHKQITREEFFKPEFRQATGDELWINMQAWVDEEFKRDFDNSNSVASDPITFEKFLQTNAQIRQFLASE